MRKSNCHFLLQCSATCDHGTRHRQVQCQQLTHEFGTASRTPSLIAESYCQGEKPAEAETCHVTVCLRPEIKADDSHYVQLQPRKIIRFKAGGRAELIEGTNARVRCIVQNFPREDIRWSLHGKEIPAKGRVKVSRKGLLLISRLLLSDSGVYTCHVGDTPLTTTIHVTTHKEARDQRIHREEHETKDGVFLQKFRDVVRKHRNRKEEYTERFLFRYFQRYELPLKFVTWGWGACSSSCGAAGMQRRRVTCELNLDQYYLIMKDIYCIERGQDRPLDSQDCGYMACPEWRADQWKEVSIASVVIIICHMACAFFAANLLSV